MIDWLSAREDWIDRKVAKMDRELEARILARLAAKGEDVAVGPVD